jgi:hypothetical protein
MKEPKHKTTIGVAAGTRAVNRPEKPPRNAAQAEIFRAAIVLLSEPVPADSNAKSEEVLRLSKSRLRAVDGETALPLLATALTTVKGPCFDVVVARIIEIEKAIGLDKVREALSSTVLSMWDTVDTVARVKIGRWIDVSDLSDCAIFKKVFRHLDPSAEDARLEEILLDNIHAQLFPPP